MKTCSSCKEIKSLDHFGKKQDNIDGLQYQCKVCLIAISKRWPSNSAERRREIYKNYTLRHPGRRVAIVRKSRSKDKERTKGWARTAYLKCRKTLEYRVRHSLRNRLLRAIKTDQKTGSAVRDLGCSIAQFRKHIEKQFLPGMSWDNWSMYGWHLDHIIPLASFDLTDREQLLKAVHYSNIRPLWAVDNLEKGKKHVREASHNKNVA